jgi:transcriptional regulator with XRE-family HTH domain
MEPTAREDQDAPVTTSRFSGDTEFKRARQLTKHSQADVAKALDVSRQTVSRWESGEREPSQEILDWLYRNRNQYASDPQPLTGLHEPRGASLRPARAQVLEPLTSKIAKAAERG